MSDWWSMENSRTHFSTFLLLLLAECSQKSPVSSTLSNLNSEIPPDSKSEKRPTVTHQLLLHRQRMVLRGAETWPLHMGQSLIIFSRLCAKIKHILQHPLIFDKPHSNSYSTSNYHRAFSSHSGETCYSCLLTAENTFYFQANLEIPSFLFPLVAHEWLHDFCFWKEAVWAHVMALPLSSPSAHRVTFDGRAARCGQNTPRNTRFPLLTGEYCCHLGLQPTAVQI